MTRGAVVVAVLASCGLTATGCSTAASHPRPVAAGSASHSHSAGVPSRPSPPDGDGNPGGLTDPQMVGQLFMPYLYGTTATDVTPEQRAANMALYGEPTPAAVVRRWHVGGVILLDHNTLDPLRATLSTGNVDSAPQIRELLSGLQSVASQNHEPPLLVGTDQEGGSVQRITDGVSPLPSEAVLAQEPAPQLTCTYFHLGTQLAALGVTLDFAPVADVVTTAGGVIGDRSFGPDPLADARDVRAAVRGLQAAGVLATLKHWPGHGSTSVDSHTALPVIHRDLTTWRHIDRVPFAGAVGAGAIMVGHLAFPAADPSGTPATFSSILTHDLLRDGLGYRGLVVTDSLWMAPALAQGGPGPMALRALGAGADVLLEPPDLPTSFTAVLHAVRTDPDVRALVREAAAQVLLTKQAQQRELAAAPATCP